MDPEKTSCCAPGAVSMLSKSEADRLARTLKALAHPVRVQIMHILGQAGGSVCVCDIETHFDIKQPTVSHHLRKLREAGLVEAEQRGLYAYYRVQPDVVNFLRNRLGILCC
jgi:ArsR family transcriptional regulator, arsenate/arsenite/antimonite-responsive transcriptional repressor